MNSSGQELPWIFLKTHPNIGISISICQKIESVQGEGWKLAPGITKIL